MNWEAPTAISSVISMVAFIATAFYDRLLPGAMAIPLSQLRERVGELPRAREIIPYCA
jgi:rhodanese-related sulfurtransferase